MNQDLIDRIAEWVRAAQRAVAFTGAGISTDSGIPDYRSPGGVWATSQPVYYDDFLTCAESRYEYWRQKSRAHADFARSRPNGAHTTLAHWQQLGRLRGVVTQNIDGLHQAAGSRDVLELHGTARQVGCLSCGERWPADSFVSYFLEHDRVPNCPECGGLLKHATISFGQALDADTVQAAVQWSREADLFLAIGSSLVVEPAASLPRIAKKHGARLVIVNRDPTPQDALADVVVAAEIGPTLETLRARVEAGETRAGNAGRGE